jgi:hypothetical protein
MKVAAIAAAVVAMATVVRAWQQDDSHDFAELDLGMCVRLP